MDQPYQSRVAPWEYARLRQYCTEGFSCCGLSGARMWIVAAFVISRLLYFAAGVRFDARPLWTYFQFVEPDLLRERLWESLFYLHMQPPGMNLMAGLVLKLFPDRPAPALEAIYLMAGLVTALGVFELTRVMGVRTAIGVPAAICFAVSPGMVLFENLLIYEYLSLAQLVAAALLLHRFVERPGLGRGLAFQAVMLSLMLVRNSFHLPYYLVIVAAMWWLMRANRRVILASAALPVILMTALHVKNWVLFGQFTTSTWLGLNAGTVTTHQLTEQERRDLNVAGILSDIGMIDPAQNLSVYKPYITMPPPTGIGVLDLEQGIRRRANFNHPAYFQVHRLYIEDAKRILAHYPRAYLRSVAIAWFCYFLPPGDLPFFAENRERIHGWDRLVNMVVFGQWKEAATRKELRWIHAAEGTMALWWYTGLNLLVGLPLLFLWGARRLWLGNRRGTLAVSQCAVMAFMLYNIASLTLLSNFLSSFENNRYRLPVDGFYVVLVAMVVAQLCRYVEKARGSGISWGNLSISKSYGKKQGL